MSLREKAVKGVFWSAVQNWGSGLFAAVTFFVLANLLDAHPAVLVYLVLIFQSASKHSVKILVEMAYLMLAHHSVILNSYVLLLQIANK